MPQDLLAIINQYGGKMKETFGVPVKRSRKPSSTASARSTSTPTSAFAMTGAVRKFLAEYPDKFGSLVVAQPAREAAKAIAKQRYLEFGCEGQAPKIKPRSLADIAAAYARGELGQKVN